MLRISPFRGIVFSEKSVETVFSITVMMIREEYESIKK